MYNSGWITDSFDWITLDRVLLFINPEAGYWSWSTENKVPNAMLLRGKRKLYRSPPQRYPTSLILNVSTKCNLRCKYCFASGTSEEMMKEEVVDAAIQILRNAPYRNVRIEFQGGRSLLNFEIKFRCEVFQDLYLFKKRIVNNETIVKRGVLI